MTFLVPGIVVHPKGDIVKAMHIAEGETGTVTRIGTVNICCKHLALVQLLTYAHAIPYAEADGPCEWCLEEENRE